MPTESYDIPTISINDNEIKDLLKHIYKYELLLKENGVIKLAPTSNLKNVLKKTPLNKSLCSTIQQVKQIDNENLIYSINTKDINEKKPIKENIVINDQMFWLLLPNGFSTQDVPSISIINNKTLFLKRVHRDQFDFHQLPHRSLLKLSGKKFCDQYSSTLIKAHGPGAIFPLSSNKENLYQLNYHHEGGIRYWYIIPSEERMRLETIFKENYPSICLKHNEILIDPLLLNKFNIKYKRIIQKPKEILILSSGVLSQGFTQDEMLSESIHFALPPWFYNYFTKNSALCHCKLSSSLDTNEPIDFNLYNDENIQEYIQKYLQINIYQNEDSKSDTDITCDNNINEDDFLMDIFDEFINIMKYSQFDNETDFSGLCSSEDFFDDIFIDNKQSESSNTTEPPSSPSNNQSINQHIQLKNKKFSRIIDRSKFIITTNNNQSEIDVNKVLYLSNLSEQISKNELRNYFIGSTKIILKQSRLPPYLNYAFIFHRTQIQAEFNRKRVIHSSCFGSNCKIKFIKNLSELSNENKCDENWNIVVKQIPENVTENYLKKLFPNSNQIKYIPSRIVQKSNKNYKTLPGFAFLSFTNIEQAHEVMKNAHEYQINNQPLMLSYYNTMNF